MKKTENKSLEQYWEERNKKFEDDKKHYKGPHCCLVMDYNIDKTSKENVSPCCYNPKFRRYSLQALIGLGWEKIDYCPYCGIRFPQELSDIWFDILEQEYGLDDPGLPEQKEKIPAEFLTDEWWKKRNL
jgi:hypothetical protein